MGYPVATSTTVFVHTLVRKFPVFAPTLTEHIADLGEILPHLFVSDVARWVEVEFHKGIISEQLKSFLLWLEDIFNENDLDVQGMIRVSFLEYIFNLEDEQGKISDFLGKSLKEQMRQILGD